YLLAALSSAAGSFDGPARQSLVPNLVPREHLPNAISMNSIMFQTASVAGPSLAGVVIAIASPAHGGPGATAGVGWVYALNAVSFVAVIIALAAMRNVPGRAKGSEGRIHLGAAVEGLKFVFQAPLIRSTMLLD